ncbi:ABC multidrug transporter atrF [Penicillium chermesinum]|nr:ABC multidrug transporter atrF [Penicillium chermesinum]
MAGATTDHGQGRAARKPSVDLINENESASTIRGDESPPKQSKQPSATQSTPESMNDGWSLLSEVKQRHQRDLDSGFKNKHLGVTWQNLNVEVISAEAAVQENVLSQFNIPTKIRESRNKPALRTILHNSHGCVKPGEMLLVLGRPGSGCTTLLKMLANHRAGYKSIQGDIHYGSMDAQEAKQFRGEIVMNTEEELFFPTLTVGNTIDFATRLKVPSELPHAVESAEASRLESKKFLLEALNIPHTTDTKVGDEYVRGVSGGERKRVSIAETFATRGSVFCWDNSTRGLDASTALEWTKIVRGLTDTLGLTSIVTLYQAGNGIYELFDKVLVLDEGEQVYYGPRAEARPFMEEAGFVCREGSNVADFLTGVTVPHERRIRDGYENQFPRNKAALRELYENSPIHERMIAEYGYPTEDATRERTEEFKKAVAFETSKRLPKGSPFTVGLPEQVKACVIRQYQILWGDRASFTVKQVATLMQALIAGSLFYSAPNNSAGLFVKSGALFFSLLYNSLLAMSEVTDSFSGRPVLIKHKAFAYFHPAAFCFAQIAADIPVLLFQVSMFSVVVYFMVGLTMSAGAFFTYWILVFSNAMTMTALFRAVGALFSTFDGASKVSGFLIAALIMYTGYMIHKPEMHPWFVWIYWIDPLAYGFEALLSNEFHSKIIPAHSHLWRNFGINWAWWALFVAVTVLATSRWKNPGDDGSTLVIPRERLGKHLQNIKADEESQFDEKSQKPSNGDAKDTQHIDNQLIRDRVLLDKVFGWVKPGMLGALMGSSGAGKTTLLDVLAQRKTSGTITGSIKVDGRDLPVMFQRSAGYCEQLDVLEPFDTVREALQDSAALRQPRETPLSEKLEYVETIIDLLELHDIADTLIGRTGAGLSVEQRKRVTIGVELVAKPSILIFLDEPTSGLDGQSAFNTVRFLRKLADVGQAVLVTIHQPSAQLFAEFDTLLLLAAGGKTVYFGEIGDNGRTVKDYFAKYGAPCPVNSNPAEHMIDCEKAVQELDEIIETAASKPPGFVDDGLEFASPLTYQTKVITTRMSRSLFRNTDYVMNKVALHIGSALFNGFSFWMIGDSVGDMQLRLFTIFNFIFVAPGVLAQLQPLFIERRSIYEQREKKSKMYSWKAFVTALIVSEIPYLCICGVLYYVCWYYTVGFPTDSNKAGATFLIMLLYEFVYTGIGQFVAAYAPNAVFASLINPLIIGTLVSFCGVLVPYSQIQAFWRYWIYWMNPFNYLIGGMLVFTVWDTDIHCKESEYAIFSPPNGSTCGDYLANYLRGMGASAHLVNPESTDKCKVCEYTHGSDYLKTLNLKAYYYGWRDIGIVAIFALSSYALVYLLMKLRTKASKKAE